MVVKVINAHGLTWKDSSSSKGHNVYFLLEIGDTVHKTEHRKVIVTTFVPSLNDDMIDKTDL